MAGAIVQTKGNDSGSTSTTIASGTLASNVTSGNFLMVGASGATGAVTITLSQNSGTATIGSWTEQEAQQESGTGDQSRWFWCQVTGTGSIDILATYGASQTGRGISVVEVSGCNAFQASSSQPDTGNNPTPTVTVNVTTQPAFGVMMGVDLQGGLMTVGSGWTDQGSTSTTDFRCRIQSKAISSTGNTTGNFVNAGFDHNNSTMLVFTEGSGTPPTGQGRGLTSQTFMSLRR